MIRQWLLAVLIAAGPALGAAPHSATFEAFGDVAVYVPDRADRLRVILLADSTVSSSSRDGLARAIVAQGGLAVVVDVERYAAAIARRGDHCAYHSWEFEKLSKYVQKEAGIDGYEPPILVGLGAGAALAYTTFTEAPRDTFVGLLLAGLCPTFTSSPPLCSGEGETWSRAGSGAAKERHNSLVPAGNGAGWRAMRQPTSGTCEAGDADSFFSGIKNLTMLPPPTATWGDEAWQASVARAVGDMRPTAESQQVAAGAPKGLPIHERRAGDRVNGPWHDTLAIIVTGDGGWAGLDRDVADTIAGAGIDVIGLNSLKYFWRERTPDEAAQALSLIIDHYGAAWGKTRFLLIGYSFGADVLPFAIRRLPPADTARIAAIALLTPGLRAEFEFHVGDWIGRRSNLAAPDIAAEIAALPEVPTLCVFGAEAEADRSTACTQALPTRVRLRRTEGGHHFDGDYEGLANAILKLVTPVDAGVSPRRP